MEENIEIKLWSDVGVSELFMTRLFHFHNYVLNGLFGISNREEIQDKLWNVVFEGLEPAFRSLRKIHVEYANPKIPEKEKQQHIENVYSYLVIAFKDRFPTVVAKMGYRIGFLFQEEKKFKNGLRQFQKDHPTLNQQFINIIKSDRSWIKILIDVRNDLIDHKAEKDPAIIEGLKKYMDLNTVEIMFNNCWRTIEDHLIVFAIDKTDPKYGHVLLEIPEFTNDKNHPQRVNWFIS